MPVEYWARGMPFYGWVYAFTSKQRGPLCWPWPECSICNAGRY